MVVKRGLRSVEGAGSDFLSDIVYERATEPRGITTCARDEKK